LAFCNIAGTAFNNKINAELLNNCTRELHRIGIEYLHQGKLIYALKYFNIILSIIERIKGKESLEFASALSNIGLACDD